MVNTMLDFNLNIFYNNDLSQIYFDDFMKEIQEDSLIVNGRNGINYIVLGNIDKPHYTKTELKAMSRDELVDMGFEYGGYDYSNYTRKSDIVEDLHQVITNEIYYKEHQEYDFTVTGYSQGDFVKVLILDKDNYKHITKDYLRNLFYDSPVYASLEILELYPDEHGIKQEKIIDEIYLDEHLSDLYQYDKEELIENLQKQLKHELKPSIISYLKNNLPEQPDYK